MRQHEPRGRGLRPCKTPLGTRDAARHGTARRTGLRTLSDRRPFLTASKAYLEDVKPYYRASTLERTARDLKTLERDLRSLKQQGRVRSLEPKEIGEQAIRELLVYWQARPSRTGTPLDGSTTAHYLNTLGNLLAWCENPVLDLMRRKRHVRFPKQQGKPIRVLGPEDLDRLRRAADSLEGWRGSTARFLVAFLPASGLRPKEIRLARLKDLDLATWTISVAHPKGEGAWAPAGNVAPILPSAQQATLDYLEERKAFLAGTDHEALLPFRRWDGPLDYWPEASLRKLKGEIVRASGVRFSLKTLRATFAQLAKDHGAPIEAVSRALRHGSTKTTETYYARIRPADAFAELRRVFETPQVRLVPKTS